LTLSPYTHYRQVPKSKLGEAISYSLNQFKKFQCYLEDGRLSIDNNRAERAVKPFVIGRKAWLFSYTNTGANASAILYSLVETAKANNLIVHDYIASCLQ
jgi:transposase